LVWRTFRAVRCAFARFFSGLASRVIEDPFSGQLLKNPTRPRTLGLGAQRDADVERRLTPELPVCNQASLM
jgi:hypothetical protein